MKKYNRLMGAVDAFNKNDAGCHEDADGALQATLSPGPLLELAAAGHRSCQCAHSFQGADQGEVSEEVLQRLTDLIPGGSTNFVLTAGFNADLVASS